MNFLTVVSLEHRIPERLSLAGDVLKKSFVVRRLAGRRDDPDDSRPAFEAASPRATSGRLTRRRPWTDRARRRRSAGLPLGAALGATHRSGPGWAGPKTPQMGPGPPAARNAHILTWDMKGNRPVFDPLQPSGFWRLRLGAVRRVRRVVEIMIFI